jgi:hypothetical protein
MSDYMIAQQNEKDTTIGKNPSSKSLSYKELLEKSQRISKGLFTVYQFRDKYYFEIPNNLLNKEILMVTRISQSASSNRINPGPGKAYPGDEISNIVVRFERLPGGKVVLRKMLYTNYSGDSSAHMSEVVARANVMPILAMFTVETNNSDSSAIVINVQDFIMADSEPFSPNALWKAYYYLAAQANDKSFINTITAFPENIEIVTYKTFTKNLAGVAYNQYGFVRATVTDNTTYELNTSLVLLPEKHMQERLDDFRVGYFSLQEMDYAANPQGIKVRKYIKRWRLEPKSADWEKYKKGELVEPEKPIIFYIDPATPPKWVPYLIQGVQDWNIAFEKAGFKNAILAKKAPSKVEDTTWSLYDARHSAIVYKPSDIENASGPSISDPRTGEILESHINWYHNVMALLHDWYMVQCAAVDANARSMTFPDSLMGKLIRFACSHEVGHALGLQHNMGASTLVCTDSLRKKSWLEKNGICPSIMDYARFNYVAQPEDSLDEKDLFPRIGEYDCWAIEWGYRLFPQYQTANDETAFLNEWVIKKTKSKALKFISEGSWDPRNQTEDLGDDFVKSSTYGIKNLKRIVPKLISWTKVPNNGYEDLSRMYDAVQNQLLRYISHVLSYIGSGMYQDMKTVEQAGPVFSPLSGNKQREAFYFISENVFKTPTWLLDTAIFARTGEIPLGVIGTLQEGILSKLFFPPFLAGMISRNSYTGKGGMYTVSEMFEDLRKSIWTELYTRATVDIYRRNLQKYYIRHLTEAFNMSKPNVGIFLPYSGATYLYASDVTSIIFGHFKRLQTDIKASLPYIKDKTTKDHFEYLYYKINMVLSAENKVEGY